MHVRHGLGPAKINMLEGDKLQPEYMYVLFCLSEECHKSTHIGNL